MGHMNSLFKTYEEYIDGAISLGDEDRLIVAFWSEPPSEWSDKYSAKIERVKREETVYSVKIVDLSRLEKFIANEMPGFDDYIEIAKEQRGVVMRLAKQLLFDTPDQRRLRLSTFKSGLDR